MTEKKASKGVTSEEPRIRCPYCEQTWPMKTPQIDIDKHMAEKHPDKPWPKKKGHYRPPGVH